MRSSTHPLLQTCFDRVVPGVRIWRGGWPHFEVSKVKKVVFQEGLGLSNALTRRSVWKENKVVPELLNWPKVILSYPQVRCKHLLEPLLPLYKNGRVDSSTPKTVVSAGFFYFENMSH
uniref:Uncharacterized protein n=1 Tax=Lepeophtheirus salmonis TaxID=72036 RepID=A0A0K2TNJ6_LEPSM